MSSATLLLALALATGCRAPGEHPAGSDWGRFVSGFLETYFQANPLFAVYQGRHDLDGRFPDWS